VRQAPRSSKNFPAFVDDTTISGPNKIWDLTANKHEQIRIEEATWWIESMFVFIRVQS
jgi:hypothetical protein